MSRREQTGIDVVSEGLMMALLRPPAGRDAEFNEWYDTEHAPYRNAVPGFLTARRWRMVPGWNGTGTVDSIRASAEEAEPLHYMAIYDLDELAVLDGPDYLGWREVASDNEWAMLDALTANDRRVYRRTPLPAYANGEDLNICGPYVLAVWWELDDEHRSEFEDWYLGEHLEMLMNVPGTRRIRRFERVDETAPGRYLALHDLESMDVFDHELNVRASRTPWRSRAIVNRRNFTSRLYKLWHRFDSPS